MKSHVEVVGRAGTEFVTPASDIALKVIKLLGQPDCFELSIKFVSEREIKRLNFEFRNTDRVTDVLSFPALKISAGSVFEPNQEDALLVSNGLYYLGDIAICMKQLIRQAKENSVTTNSELKKLVIHSMLHLFGYDHIRDEDFAVMSEKENFLAKKI